MWQWVKQNWLGFSGLVIGILGTAFAIYTYVATKAYRDLAFTTRSGTVLSVPKSVAGYPVRLVDATTGEPLDGYVIDRRFTLHNRGTQSIRSENILRPLSISVDAPDMRLLSARVSAATRPDVIGPVAEIKGTNEIALDFEILEGGDGFEVVAVFTSSAETSNATINGAIEGVDRFSQNTGPIIPSTISSAFLLTLVTAPFLLLVGSGIRATLKKSGWKTGSLEVAKAAAGILLFVAIGGAVLVAVMYPIAMLTTPRTIQPPEMAPMSVQPPQGLTAN